VTLEEVVVTATRDVEEVGRFSECYSDHQKGDRAFQCTGLVDVLRDEVGVVVRDFYGNGRQPLSTFEVLVRPPSEYPCLGGWKKGK